jgi:hypothetical protein
MVFVCDCFEKLQSLGLPAACVPAALGPNLDVIPVCKQLWIRHTIAFESSIEVSEAEQLLQVVRPALLGEALIGEIVSMFQSNHDAGLQPTLDGITREVISRRPSAGSEEDLCVTDSRFCQSLKIRSVHCQNSTDAHKSPIIVPHAGVIVPEQSLQGHYNCAADRSRRNASSASVAGCPSSSSFIATAVPAES